MPKLISGAELPEVVVELVLGGVVFDNVVVRIVVVVVAGVTVVGGAVGA